MWTALLGCISTYMRHHRLPIQVLYEPTPILYHHIMQILQRRLRISIDMTHDSLEDLGLVLGLRPQLRVQVLQLDLLAPEVLIEAAEGGALVLLAALILEGMALDALANQLRLVVKSRSHCASRSRRRERFLSEPSLR